MRPVKVKFNLSNLRSIDYSSFEIEIRLLVVLVSIIYNYEGVKCVLGKFRENYLEF